MSLTDYQLKLSYGFVLTVLLVALAFAIALGAVHKETSYGLEIVIGGLVGMLGAWGLWAFGRAAGAEETKPSVKAVEVKQDGSVV